MQCKHTAPDFKVYFIGAGTDNNLEKLHNFDVVLMDYDDLFISDAVIHLT